MGLLEEGPIRKWLKERTPISGQEEPWLYKVNGVYLIVKGHAPAGEKPEVLGYSFNEEAAKKMAIEKRGYVYQLIWSYYLILKPL